MEVKFVPGCKNFWGDGYKDYMVKPITGVVVHHTGSFNADGTIAWFTKDTGVKNKSSSAHFLIPRYGSVIHQFLTFDQRAWHAGRSEKWIGGKLWKGWNSFSVGYELVGDGNKQPYTDIQYEVFIEHLRTVVVPRFNVSRDMIVGHEQIAPGRKTNPGEQFDWQRLYDGVFKVSGAPVGGAPVSEGIPERKSTQPMLDGKDSWFELLLALFRSILN